MALSDPSNSGDGYFYVSICLGHWILEPQGDTDIRSNLMKWSVERGLIIKTLQKEDLSIEEAFQKLTKS